MGRNKATSAADTGKAALEASPHKGQWSRCESAGSDEAGSPLPKATLFMPWGVQTSRKAAASAGLPAALAKACEIVGANANPKIAKNAIQAQRCRR